MNLQMHCIVNKQKWKEITENLLFLMKSVQQIYMVFPAHSKQLEQITMRLTAQNIYYTTLILEQQVTYLVA